MKLHYDYNDFISKLQEIYENHKNNVLSSSMLVENNKKIVENKNKKTKEEILSNALLRKQKQIENLKEKYNNEEYKKLRSKEIAKNRREKMGI
jgi:flagellar biosynthesis chaperone FliJ